MDSGIDLDWNTVVRAFGVAYFNLLRRGANGSLTLSTDHWRLDELSDGVCRFSAREEDAPPLEVATRSTFESGSTVGTADTGNAAAFIDGFTARRLRT